MNNSLDDMPSGDTLIDYTSLGPTEPPRPFDPAQELERHGIKVSQAKDAVWRDEEPRGYQVRKDGVWHIEPKPEADPVETWLCDPVNVLGKTRDTQSQSWGLFLEWKDDDAVAHKLALSRASLVSRDNDWLKILVDGGLRITSVSKARGLLSNYFMMHKTSSRILCTDATGWHKRAYVFPDNTLSNDADTQERIVLQTTTPQNPYTIEGTLEDWQQTIGEWSRGNSRLMFAICASLSGTLLGPLGLENGGFNFVGGSSTGKTTALCVAASVYGKGTSQGGFIRTWRSTDNGLEGIACTHNDACLCLDELGQAPPRVAQNATYMLGNGQGKARARQNGTAKEGRTWRTIILSSGEKTIAEKIAEDGGKIQAGQEVRLADISADSGAGLGMFEDVHDFESARAFADALKDASSKNYGHMSRAFIEQVQTHWDSGDIEKMKDYMANGIRLICDDPEADGQVLRVARRFLLAAMTGEMARTWGLLPWSVGEAVQAAKTCFDTWLAQRGGVGAHEDRAILEQVMLFIENHGASRFQDVENLGTLCVNRVGFKRQTDQCTEYYILPESFKAEVCKGVSSRRAVKVLDKEGLLVRDTTGEAQKKVTLPKIGRPRCYVIRLAESDGD